MSDETQKSNDAIKFVAWAVGVGVSATFAIIVYAHSTFPTKDYFGAVQRGKDQEILNLKEAVVEIKKSNSDFQNWLRDNWSRRHPERTR